MFGQPLSAERVADLNEINCQPFQSRNNSAVIASVVALHHQFVPEGLVYLWRYDETSPVGYEETRGLARMD